LATVRASPGLAVIAALVTVFTAAACTQDNRSPAASVDGPKSSPAPTPPRGGDGSSLRITGSDASIPVEYLADNVLHLSSGATLVRLNTAPHPALQGTLAPLVVESPGGDLLAFSGFTPAGALDPARSPSEQGVFLGDPLGTPALVVHDLHSGGEQILAEGAYSPAWRDDGAIAYVQGSDPVLRANTPFLGQIYVRPSPAGEPEQWTLGEDRYVVAGWVGSALLYYHAAENESFDLEVTDGPGRARTLAPASTLVAVSPDRRQVAVATSANGGSSELKVLDLASGETVARAETAPLTSIVYRGSWVGSRLVARGGDRDGHLLHVFEIGDGRVRLQRALRVDQRLPSGLAEPLLNAGDPELLSAWSYIPDDRHSGHYVLVGCDLRTATCVTGPEMRAKVVRLIFRSGR
jgi:hypothetical protein